MLIRVGYFDRRHSFTTRHGRISMYGCWCCEHYTNHAHALSNAAAVLATTTKNTCGGGGWSVGLNMGYRVTALKKLT